MNFISGTHAVSLFPASVSVLQTPLSEVSSNVKGDLSELARNAEEQEQVYKIAATGAVAAVEPGPRSVGDAQCWLIPFRKSRKYILRDKKFALIA